ncbi:LuxR C-terminal-related transcriptional regulator [Solihabitans fulvus]|uniref:LuxR C-terminal-related transcriptional regulator n=1 Tax=Solihabitans fulvus TaxID=1892852 RepID=UPI001661E78E|nr:hypothetical protein [Solihabitans fulvus]
MTRLRPVPQCGMAVISCASRPRTDPRTEVVSTEVLRLLAKACGNIEIAAAMRVGEETVTTHVS